MQHFDLAESNEVGGTKGENLLDPIHPHYSYQAGIVRVLSGNVIDADQSFPCRENVGALRQDFEHFFEGGELACNPRDTQA
jgi:hypothetical protein